MDRTEKHIGTPIMQVEGLSFSYRTRRSSSEVLNNVSVSIHPGEFVSIMGPSGSGKSTLMNILGCLDSPQSGTYLFDGVDISTLSGDELAFIRMNSIGFVFQSFHLMQKLTVVQNVELPLKYSGLKKPVRKKRALEVLHDVGLDDKVFGNRANELSGGQMQRVAIARAMVNDPPVILADEPTGNLDRSSGTTVLEAFRKLNSIGKTVVLITHDPQASSYADRIITIVDGAIVG